MKKVISIILILSVVLSMLGAINGFAKAYSGNCGDNLKWEINGDTLTISGKGEMDFGEYPPWVKDTWNWIYHGTFKSIIILPGVTSIADNAFFNCDSVTSISIPSTVREIGHQSFSGCVNLPRIILPEGLTTIGTCAFDRCIALEKIALPESLTSIGENAFRSCKKLKNVVLSNKIEYIANGTFSYCNELETIVIPQSVQSTNEGAFYDSKNLKIVALPDDVLLNYNTYKAIFGSGTKRMNYRGKLIKVRLNEYPIAFDVQPTEISGRVLVPVRAIFEALGAKVDWNESKNEVIATKGDVTIRLYKDNTTMYRNNKAITLDVPAKDIDDRILVPVRAISEAFGCKVDWDEANSQVLIKDSKLAEQESLYDTAENKNPSRDEILDLIGGIVDAKEAEENAKNKDSYSPSTASTYTGTNIPKYEFVIGGSEYDCEYFNFGSIHAVEHIYFSNDRPENAIKYGTALEEYGFTYQGLSSSDGYTGGFGIDYNYYDNNHFVTIHYTKTFITIRIQDR